MKTSDEPNATPVYQPHPKHKWDFSAAGPPRHVPGASKCPRELGPTDATSMLRTALEKGYVSGEIREGFAKRVFAFTDGRFYCGILTSPSDGAYHGFPVDAMEVPTVIKRLMRDNGTLTHGEYKRFCTSFR